MKRKLLCWLAPATMFQTVKMECVTEVSFGVASKSIRLASLSSFASVFFLVSTNSTTGILCPDVKQLHSIILDQFSFVPLELLDAFFDPKLTVELEVAFYLSIQAELIEKLLGKMSDVRSLIIEGRCQSTEKRRVIVHELVEHIEIGMKCSLSSISTTKLVGKAFLRCFLNASSSRSIITFNKDVIFIVYFFSLSFSFVSQFTRTFS